MEWRGQKKTKTGRIVLTLMRANVGRIRQPHRADQCADIGAQAEEEALRQQTEQERLVVKLPNTASLLAQILNTTVSGAAVS